MKMMVKCNNIWKLLFCIDIKDYGEGSSFEENTAENIKKIDV